MGAYCGAVGKRAARRRRRGLLGVLGAVLLIALVAWACVCVRVVGHPQVDARQKVDAVYVIGPVETRIDQVLRTMDTGVAPLLVATTSIDGRTGQPYATDHCGLRTGRYEVECVVPEPYTTRGEARVLGRLVRERGWDRVAVVTSTPHAARTRMLMERCTDAEVLVWTVEEERGPVGWVQASVYQSAAWVKAQLARGC